jgi:hypothetical protein
VAASRSPETELRSWEAWQIARSVNINFNTQRCPVADRIGASNVADVVVGGYDNRESGGYGVILGGQSITDAMFLRRGKEDVTTRKPPVSSDASENKTVASLSRTFHAVR